MRFVSYDAGNGPRAGLLRDGQVVEAGGSLRELIAAGPLSEPSGGTTHELSDVKLLPPITDPEKLICIGLNYLSHAQEQDVEPPEYPTVFAKFRNALRPHGDEVKLPEYSSKVDYEAEVAFVIGRRAKDVAEADALDYIAGYTLLNDLSARDYQFMTPQWMPGKIFDGAAPCGPALVTPDEAGPPDQIGIALHLNGEQMQGATTADLIHSIPFLLAHLSKLLTLEPGDVVSTGTPSGVGSLREPRMWLKPGDDVVVSSPQLGELRTLMA